jgi:AhpD family alkylhydroperoxidase
MTDGAKIDSPWETDAMHNDWSKLIGELKGPLRELRTGTPDVMKGFSTIAQAAIKANALDSKTKELIALAVAVAIRCDDCIAFHAKAALEQEASREEVLEALGMAIYMGAGPAVMYASHAIEAYDQLGAAKTIEAVG